MLTAPAIVDGFFVMVKPLAPGFHTIVVHGTNTLGDDRTYTTTGSPSPAEARPETWSPRRRGGPKHARSLASRF